MSDELTWLPAWQIRDLIAKGEVAATEVTEHFLDRIEALNPTLHAFAHLDADGARQQARRADEAVRRGDDLGPLHGVPVSIKEHIAVQGMPLMGVRGTPSTTARADDVGIERIRKAGAIIFGTNTMMGTGGGAIPQAEGGGRYLSFNWDAEARNPWDPSKVPGWSSSGGAASAVAGLIPVAIGSDGGGSTRLPAAYSGVVGVHPTRGLVPYINYEHPTFALSVTTGPLVRDVRDAAMVTQVMAGPDGRDYICIQQDPPDYLERLDAGVEGLRLAWSEDFGFTSLYKAAESDRVLALIRDAALGLRTLGAEVEPSEEVWEDPQRGGGPGPGEPSVYEVSVGHNTEPLPAHSPQGYQSAMEARARNWDKFRRLFGQYDLLVAPTSQRVARSVEEWNAGWTSEGSRYPHGTFAPTYVCHTALFNLLGFPAVSVPCGFVDGLPVGLQIVGWPGREALIFRAASAFQHAFPRHEHPGLSNL